jgi:TPP-dependent pyruvate/acetoin dehydrogenase alpha subunit
LEGIRSRVKDEVHEAVERADADGFADPSEAHLGVFAEPGWGDDDA